MSDAPPIGTPVALRDRKLAEQLGRGDEVGIVLQRRRSDARVIYLSDRKAHWIDDARLWPVPAATPALQRLSTLLGLLEPEEAQLERADAEALEIHILCTGFDARSAASLRERLGDALLNWSAQPYGMAFFTLVVELRPD